MPQTPSSAHLRTPRSSRGRVSKIYVGRINNSFHLVCRLVEETNSFIGRFPPLKYASF
jgi:hypothetical protein